jgi:hypothetical protein
LFSDANILIRATAASLPLLVECERLLQHVSAAPHCRGQMEHLLSLREHIADALAEEDFERVASLGASVHALMPQSVHEALSEEDYLTLPARHTALVQRVSKRCRKLCEEKDHAAQARLAAELEALKSPETTAVIAEVAEVAGKQRKWTVSVEHTLSSR